jgi:hypothetical protein
MPPESRLHLALKRMARGLGLADLQSRRKTPDQGAGPLAQCGAHVSLLVAFHCGDGLDHAGRRHESILAFSDQAMHDGHDFIQWLFPLPEPSQAFHAAPVMSEDDLLVMRRSEVCLARLHAANARMMRFLADNPVWLRAHDHNHLRITRMIRSTRLIAGEESANRLKTFVLDHARAKAAEINPTTLAFWTSA